MDKRLNPDTNIVSIELDLYDFWVITEEFMKNFDTIDIFEILISVTGFVFEENYWCI